jgi:AcrR family transcriptional regulator
VIYQEMAASVETPPAEQAERPGTRDRIVYASAELFRRHGYAATGLKQIVAEADAPFGSIYHFFPGGKEELGAETIRVGGRFFLALATGYLEQFGDPAVAIAEFFDGAAENLVATDYADACPIATLALEVASTSEPLRVATAEAFQSWLEALADRFAAAGMAEAPARELALAVLSALEGAFVLSRASRSTEPLAAARGMAVAAIERALS